jgi:hypothetical protein
VIASYAGIPVMQTLTTQNNTCPCCGWDGLKVPAYGNLSTLPVSDMLEPPYSQYFGEPSYEVCACCGYEFGNDDEPGTGAPVSFKDHLNELMKAGSHWFDPARCRGN